MNSSVETQKQRSKATGFLTQREHEWFDTFINDIKRHKLLLDTKTASKELEETYKVLIDGNDYEVSRYGKYLAERNLIKKAVIDYISELKKLNLLPKKLSFDLSECHILIWAEIKVDDDKTEDALILTEAKVNFKYKNAGIDISSTILEDCDNIPVPPNYSQIL